LHHLKAAISLAVFTSAFIACNTNSSTEPAQGESSAAVSSSSSVEESANSSSNTKFSSSYLDLISSSSGTISSSSIMTIPPEDAITGSFTDERDGQTYKTVTIGNQTWMAQNLNYADSSATGLPNLYRHISCYDQSPDSCAKYGHLYDWAGAMNFESDKNSVSDSVHQGACPNGWHIPKVEEWNTLFDAIGGINNAYLLKSRTDWIEDGAGIDAYGFSILPAGQIYYTGYTDNRLATSFWTPENESKSLSYPYLITFSRGNNAAKESTLKEYAYSVRCLKNDN